MTVLPAVNVCNKMFYHFKCARHI